MGAQRRRAVGRFLGGLAGGENEFDENPGGQRQDRRLIRHQLDTVALEMFNKKSIAWRPRDL